MKDTRKPYQPTQRDMTNIGGIMVRIFVYSLSLFLIACTEPNVSEESRTHVLDTLVKKTTWKSSPSAFIAHAGGGIDHLKYTNSKEAILNSIHNGMKLIEIDLIATSDGHLVGAHHWSHFKEITDYKGTHDETPLSLRQFKNAIIYNKYTPIALTEISSLFSQYDDLILVTDKSNDFELILKEYIHHNRLVVEIFGTDNYKKALNAGIKYPALNTKFSEEDKKFIVNNDVKIVAFRTSRLKNKSTLDYANYLYSKGVSSMVYTTSDEIFIEEHIGESATMFYTNFWSLSEKRCIHPDPENCKSDF